MLIKGIISFPTLFTPKVAKGATEPKFSCGILLPPTDPRQNLTASHLVTPVLMSASIYTTRSTQEKTTMIRVSQAGISLLVLRKLMIDQQSSISITIRSSIQVLCFLAWSLMLMLVSADTPRVKAASAVGLTVS